MSNWHYMKNGAQTGPVTEDELKAQISSGAVKSDTLVWREGLTSWVAVNTLPEFAGIAAPAMPPPPPTPSPTPHGAAEKPEEFVPDAADVEQNKVMGVLAYIIFLIPLLAARQSRFAMFHCNQGLILFLLFLGTWIGLGIVSFVLAFIPVIGWILSTVLWMAFVVSVLCFVLVGIINAANGRCRPLPVVGRLCTLVK
jgi:uncharacterized membrane protein